MKFEYTGRHVEVTPAIRAHVESHFDKISHLFADSTARAHIRIEVEKNRHIGEIVVHWREHTMTATDTNSDMYQALTRAIAKIEKQAIKLKKKIIDRHQTSARTIALETTSSADGSAAIDHRLGVQTADVAAAVSAADGNDGSRIPRGGADSDGGASDARPPRIIAARRYAVKPMTPEEALVQLADEANQFLVFRDADTDRIGVLYKRKDGNYGLIEP
jgi:putative sigma-54 modulation protein